MFKVVVLIMALYGEVRWALGLAECLGYYESSAELLCAVICLYRGTRMMMMNTSTGTIVVIPILVHVLQFKFVILVFCVWV